MAKERLTHKQIELLKAPEKETLIWDTELPGFGLRAQPSGRLVYIVQYRVAGRSRRVNLGRHGAVTLDQARRAAKAYLGHAAQGEDLSRERRRDRLTVADTAEVWIEQHVRPTLSPRTLRDYLQVLRLYVLPRFGSRFADELTKTDVTSFRTSMAQTPKVANYSLAVLKAMFNFAIDNGLLPEGHQNPSARVKMYRLERRERFLGDDELRRVGDAITQLEAENLLSPWSAAAIRLLVFTGARSGEVMTLQWEHVDFDRRALLLPTSKTGRKTVLLNAPALSVLQAVPRVRNNPFVIVGQVPGRPMKTLRVPWERICARAGVTGVRIHDLRHSYASFGAGRGLSLPVIGKLLGHSQPSTTQRYAHLADDPIRRANDDIGNHLSSLMAPPEAPSGPPAEVVPLRGGRR